MRAAVVVAHPDDEILFAGSLILSQPETAWSIICLTHGTGERGDHFSEVCSRLGVAGYCWSLPDEGMIWTREQYIAMHATIRQADLQTYNEVYTHGAKGEYGHPHHIAINDAVLSQCPWAWQFYTPVIGGTGQQELLEETVAVQAHPEKVSLFQSAYGRETYNSLVANHPEMMARLFEKEEFTR